MNEITEAQIELISPCFPRFRGIKHLNDRKVLSGIIYVLKNGPRWRDAPKEYSPHKTLYNRFVRWSEKRIFQNIFKSLSKMENPPEQLQIDSTYIEAHQTAMFLLKKRDSNRRIGKTKGEFNSKIHLVTDGIGKPLFIELTSGNISDYTVSTQIIAG